MSTYYPPPAPRSGSNPTNATALAAGATTVTAAPPSTASTGNPSASTGMVQRTGASEGFYRRNWQAQSREESVSASLEATGQNRPAITVTTDLPAEPLQPSPLQSPDDAESHRRRSFSAPVRPETMNRITDATSPTRSGALRPPGELGQSPTTQPSRDEAEPKPMQAHPLTIATRKRLAAAVQRGHALDQQVESNPPDAASTPPRASSHPSLVTSLCYAGMEVIMASVSGRDKNADSAVFCLCARTRLVLQQLDLSFHLETSSHEALPTHGTHYIQSLQSHPVTGQVCVAHSTGLIWTFFPVETNPLDECFGRFRWRPGPIIDASRTFDRTSGTVSPDAVVRHHWNVSLAGDGKVLVSHGDQVAVFDGAPLYVSSHGYTLTASHTLAELVWTMQLPGRVVTAKISGDGQAIAVVLHRERSETEDEDDIQAATDGVHTFERDAEDGSLDASGARNGNTTLVPRMDPHRPTLHRHASQGILYKPGPFLVHSAPVTRLAFRGYGTVTSSPLDVASPGNDLLLTYCDGDGTARIYGQNHWNPLTEWTTAPQTRVEWVKCISAFSLGDLESIKKPSGATKRGVAVSQGLGSDGVGGSTTVGVPDSPDALSKRLHFSSMPNASSSSHAGAWVVEISFHDPYPALRLFRLAYLERGVDDLNPTLLESVSSYLPLNCLSRERILSINAHGDDGSSCLSIEGVWPAWNAWLSESTELSTTDTVSGSAMASLGLSSGPAIGNNGSMAGTPNPPSELRLVSSHLMGGLVSVLDFPVFGDKGLTLFELGNPVRNILSIQHLNNCRVVPSSVKRVKSHKASVCASLTYESSRLVAELDDDDSHSVRILWRKAGTMSFLPFNWLPDDVDPRKAVALLQNNSNNLRDESLIPAPLALPSVHIPTSMFSADQSICVLLWWPDSTSFGGSPLLAAVMSDGTIVVFEIPPPASSLEPPLPKFSKPLPPPAMAFDMNGLTFSRSFDDDDTDQPTHEYEVSILSDPEYGLGLRLESQPDGMCAIAGSFKKHPLNGDILPAEKCGLIRLGDELLSANDTNLKDMPFDDIVSAVREVGATSGPGNPIRLKFQRSSSSVTRKNSFNSGSAFHKRQGSQLSDTSRNRRTMEQMLGVNAEEITRNVTSRVTSRHQPSEHRAADIPNTDRASPTLSTQPVPVVSSIAGVFPHAIAIDSNSPCDINTSLALVDWNPDQYCGEPTNYCRNALLFWSKGSVLMVTQLAIGSNCEMERAECLLLGELTMPSPGEVTDDIRAFDVVDRDNNGYTIAVASQSGRVSLVSLTLGVQGKTELTFESHTVFRLNNPWSRGCGLQVHSSELIVTTQPNAEGVCSCITIWSSFPGSGCRLNESSQYPSESWEYYPTNVSTDYSPDGDAFLEYRILPSGYLDAYPSLVSFSMKHVTLFQKRGGQPDWLPSAQISYNTSPWVTRTSPSPNLLGTCNFEMNDKPCDMFPHLLSGVLSVTAPCDETSFLRSDWHPDSLIAYVCTDNRGAKRALIDGVYFVLNWLCSEGREVSESHAERPLTISSVAALDRECDDGQVESTPFNVVDALTAPQCESKSASPIETLQLEILAHLSTGTLNSTAIRDNQTDGERETSANNELPAVLCSMEREDLCLLWAIGDLCCNPPCFGSSDRSGQLFLFSSAVFLKANEIADRLSQQRQSVSRRISSTSKTSSEFETIASTGALGALVSSNQVHISKSCRLPNEKMTWRFARQHRIAFWERSDQVLARIAEEIGQTIFRDTRDSMESALFFVIARKTRTLRNLAATDQSDTGTKLSKFLMAHDFSSERGRRAAEKNAFSLLRKCRYGVAAAFFLLADPPFLNAALETIATKMQDHDLAFFVARLMENSELGCASDSFSTTSMLARLSSAGAGYASVGPPQESVENDLPDQKFDAWKPKLGVEAHRLLIDRILPANADDGAMAALLLVWLGKNDEAVWFLSGHVDVKFAGLTEYRDVKDVSLRLFHRLAKPPRHARIADVLLSPTKKANALIDFTSAMILVDALCGSSRVRAATSLGISRALTSRGVELSAVRMVANFIDLVETDDKENKNFGFVAAGASTRDTVTNGLTSCENPGRGSSIFDEYSAPPKPSCLSTESTGSQTATGESSIFDAFDVRPPAPEKVRAQQLPVTAEMQSSIFDDFDVKQPVRQNHPQAATSIQSSIFDAFDVPLPTQKAAAPSTTSFVTTTTDNVQSSIFDAFDVPPMQKTAMTTSSIFDMYDVNPAGQTTTSTLASVPPQPSDSHQASRQSAPNGGMQSSIFDEFDERPVFKRESVPTNIPPTTRAHGLEPLVEGGQGETSQMKPKGSSRPPAAVYSRANVSLVIEEHPTPTIWMEWRNNVMLDAVARRLLRVVASVISSFQGDQVEAPIHDFFKFHDHMLVPMSSEVLQLPCDTGRFLGIIRQSLEELSNAGRVDPLSLVRRSIFLLGSRHNHRVLFSVLLYAATERADLGEAVVRTCANALISRCDSFSLARDDLTQKSRTRAYVSSQFCRREAARLGWQLETCLWFHRGGGLALSGMAFNEAIVAVRVGLLLASWNKNFKCMEAMIQSDPDCLIDESAGRHLWTSLKIVDSSKADFASKKASSGGWEFLVNCKRSQATELLRDRATGCFIIRPHVEDHGVFTLSFKTNLVPDRVETKTDDVRETESRTPDTSGDELDADALATKRKDKKVRKEDVVQHAIIRLSDSGFRCGSFGPFTSLISLLEAVSSSLPFNLRFDLPPKNQVISDEGSQTSPNAILFRKLSLRPSESFKAKLNDDFHLIPTGDAPSFGEHVHSLGVFAQLAVACRVRRQLSGVAAFVYNDELDESVSIEQATVPAEEQSHDHARTQCYSQFSMSSRLVGPLLTWCRSMEISLIHGLAPDLRRTSQSTESILENETESSDNVTESPDAIEVSAIHSARYIDGGDSILRGMIQQGSGVEFSTLRLIDAGECTMLVLFSRKEAVRWLVSLGIEQTDETAVARLDVMERDRVIEPVDLTLLPLKQKSMDLDQDVRYRFVDPWEVEALMNREGETRNASLGRGRFIGFGLGHLSLATDHNVRELGGDELLELWTSAKCGILLTKALATVHPPWERAASGDLHLTKGKVSEPPPLMNSIRRCLYRNTLYRRLDLPQRFLALVQVELLDLKNLTSPGGSLSLTAYALLRLKRVGSGGTLTNKARTLDSASTAPVKLNKTSGPNAPASWGSVVRFRFPLPEDASVDGTSYDRDRESLFKGPPRVLQVSVYEKKLLADHALGTADISTDGLSAGGQVEEWVPLRSEKRGITWFARIRLTLRFELMCIASPGQVSKESVPSVGLQRIYELNHSGGSAHEDIQKRSTSSPDLLSYFEGIVY